MLLKITIKQLNKDYSKELATQELQRDPESIANLKYQMEVSMKEFVEVDKFLIEENQDLTVEIVNADDQMGSLTLRNMTIFRGLKAGKVKLEYAVSKGLIEKTSSLPKEKEKKYFYIYLKDVEDIGSIGRRVYFLKRDIVSMDPNFSV